MAHRPKHLGTPKITRTNYPSTISAACSRYGDGQCDGYVYEDETAPENSTDDCACDCHGGWSDCPTDTLAAVEKWHHDQHRLFG